MRKKKHFAKTLATSLLAVTMVASSMAMTVPMSASAGQVLGETSFKYKALPWHTCESSPAKQNFAIENDSFHITIVKADGADGDKWDLQFRHRNLNLKSGHSYTISFKAKAKRNGMHLCSKIGEIGGEQKEYVELFKDGTIGAGPAMNGQWGGPVELSTEYKEFSGSFTCTQDLEGVEWTFHYANATTHPDWGGNAKDGDEIWFTAMNLTCETCSECDSDPNESYGAVNRDYAAAAADDMGSLGSTKNFVSVNQIGYYPKLQKIAVLGDNSGDILHGATKISLSGTYGFDVIDAKTGKVAWSGTSTAPEYDADSDDNCCKLDFTEFQQEGRYYIQIKGQEWRSFEFNIGNDIYLDKSHNLLTNAMNYFYQNRSGVDIDDKYCTSGGEDGKGTGMGHKGGHKTDTAAIQKIWKNEYSSIEEASSTYKSGSLTANGGWYDAGDHGKYVVNGGIAIWTLQNMYERAILQSDYDKKFDDNSGIVVVPEAGNGVPDVLDEAAIELDWIADMKVVSSDTAWGRYDGLYYHKLHDHKWTGLATRPWDYETEWETTRIVKPPTLAATLNYAACAGQAARLWAPYNKKQAEDYLSSAIDAYNAYKDHWYPYDKTPTTHPTLGCECCMEELNETSLYAPMWHAKGGGPYGDNNVLDDAYWAACEIFASASAMGNSAADTFKKEIDASEYAYTCDTRMVGGENKDGSFTSFNWGNTASCGSLTLALHSELLSDSENTKIAAAITTAATDYVKCESEQGYGTPYKYDGPAYNDPNNLDPAIKIKGYEWGSNSMVINNCIVMAYAYDLTGNVAYMNGVVSALDYLFGCNPLSFCYVTGYGTYHERNPHHRYWSYELDKTLPMAPDGVLSGGPNAGLQDPYVRALGFVPGNTENPSQRCFVDSIEAWSTNEVTINWNAPLAWIASFMQDEAANTGDTPIIPPEPGDTDYGNVNCSQGATYVDRVTLDDAVLLAKALGGVGGVSLTTQGRANADVAADGDVNNADLTKLLSFLAGSIEYSELGK